MADKPNIPSAAQLQALGEMVQAYRQSPELAALGSLYGSQQPQWQPPEAVMRLQQLFNAAQQGLRGPPVAPPNYQQLGIRG